MNHKTTHSFYTVFKQVVQYIPAGIIPKLSKKYRIQTRKFSVLSQIMAILYGHIARAWSLNEICDAALCISPNGALSVRLLLPSEILSLMPTVPVILTLLKIFTGQLRNIFSLWIVPLLRDVSIQVF